ncbi:mitochondrial glycoprotein [Mycena maculata]|uniref:Mitochondrial glycoprotein n=1 Tax=Mycena maculata TaxID=230809 RepID=A0AAD7KID6_9AGAR|nr:mitochondrial glycoprotein [Mycena maculata]
MSALRPIRNLVAASTRLCRSSPSLPRPSLRATKTSTATRAFSVSPRSLEDKTSLNVTLARKLNDELEYEVRTAKETGSDGTPDFLKAFRKEGVWELHDTPGNDEIFLTRKFGDESIRVMFSIADLQNPYEDEEHPDEDPNKEPPPEFRVALSITKSGDPGALNADLYCTEGTFQPAIMSFYKSAKIGQELSIESDFARRTLYAGPPFEMLDLALQENFGQFLQERGIVGQLAVFVEEYAKWKEQREYIQWLQDVAKFIEA